MSLSRSALLSYASAFLSSSEPLGLEAASASRLTALVRAFTTGELDAAGLRAALGSDRPAPTRPTPKGTAVIELVGVLTPSPSLFSMLGFGTNVRDFTQRLMAAATDPAVKAIAVVVDSPGGQIRQIPEAAKVMRFVRAHKPVVAVVVGLDASAAYWLTANATAIEATPSASVGAIGVLCERVSVVRQLAQDGIDVEVFAAGKHKAEGHPATAITDAERQARQADVDTAYTQFVSDVAAGRQTAPATVRMGYGEGRLVTAAEGLRLGMIDRVALVEETLDRIVSAPATFGASHAARARLAAQVPVLHGDAARADLADRRRALVAAALGSVTR